MRPKIENPVQFLRDSGILFEINRQVLHPLGMEIHLQLDDEGRIEEVSLEDNRENPIPIHFSAEAFNEGRSRYEDYLEEHGRRNIQKRRRAGMVIQTGPHAERQLTEIEREDARDTEAPRESEGADG